MRKTVLLACVAAAARFSAGAVASVWYVDADAPATGEGTSWAKAFKSIQEGIAAAADGDRVVVAPGTYLENIRFEGKNIVLRSTNPLDPEVVRGTVIDGDGADSAVSFSGTEKAICVLAGFTIRNGRADYGGGVRGGTESTHTLATIRNNIITGNRADEG
ncbi:MAG: hypothetical protein Q8Q12_07225 [bacterium]|nr:hypothetical protein [bacterium]